MTADLAERGEPLVHRTWATKQEQYAYNVGVGDGNAASTRLLVGCPRPIRLVVDPSVPEGVAELRVRSRDQVFAPSIALDLLAL